MISTERQKYYAKQYRESHKEELSKKREIYCEVHKEEMKLQRKIRDQNLRINVLSHYSNGNLMCKICEDNNIEFLEIDHLNGGGRQHRKKIKTSIYMWLKKNNYPKGYQVLCSNCNNKKLKIVAREKGIIGTKSQQLHYKYNINLKMNIFSHYMTDNKIKCSCPNCNVDDIDLLCLDHKNNDGEKHRILRKRVWGNIYRDVRDAHYPDDYRILCYNCNQSLGKYGYCPHNGG